MKPIIAGRDEALVVSAERTPSVRWVLAGLSLSMLLSSLGTSIANVGLPVMAQAFGASFQEVQWVVLAYLLAITTLIVSVGRLGDIAGRRRLLLAGIVLFTMASGLSGAAPTLGLLIVARAAQGLGAAIMMALTMAFVGATVPRARTGSAMGLLGTMSAIGTALGPSLGGLLIAWIGWRAIFLVSVPLGFLAFVLAYRCLPVDVTDSKTKRAGFDTMGTLLLGASLAAYALAMTIGRGHFGPLNVALLASCDSRHRPVRAGRIQSSIAFDPTGDVPRSRAACEPRHERARLDGDHGDAGGRAVLSVTCTGARNGIGRAGAFGWAARRSVDRRAGRPHGRSIWLRAHDHRRARRHGGRLCLLSTMPATSGIAGYVGSIVLVTAGYAMFQAANNTAVMTDVRPDQRGVISGMLNLSRNLGLITGASAMGAVFALASAASDVATAGPEAVEAGMRITFAVAALLIVIALAIAASGYRRASTQS